MNSKRWKSRKTTNTCNYLMICSKEQNPRKDSEDAAYFTADGAGEPNVVVCDIVVGFV